MEKNPSETEDLEGISEKKTNLKGLPCNNVKVFAK